MEFTDENVKRNLGTLKSFKRQSNNYWNWWTDYRRGEEKRQEPAFREFIERYQRFSKRLIQRTSEAIQDRYSDTPFEERLPWNDLYASFKKIFEIMSKAGFEEGNPRYSGKKGTFRVISERERVSYLQG